MRRLASSFLVLLVTVAAALPGAAAFAVPFDTPESDPCFEVNPGDLLPAVEASNIIAIGTVENYNGGGRARILPEAFLKGAAGNDPIDLRYEELEGCALAQLVEPSRVLVFLHVDDAGPAWPNAGRVFWLDGGYAQGGGGDATRTTEAELVRDVRHITEQYAIPAANEAEGAEMDWWKTIVPVSAATLGLLAVGLYLMRIWHRIDPS